MEKGHAEAAERPVVGLGERIVIFAALAVVTCLGLAGFWLNGESGFWVALVIGVVGFTIVHGIFNVQLKAFYGRFKPSKYDGAVEIAVNAIDVALRK